MDRSIKGKLFCFKFSVSLFCQFCFSLSQRGGQTTDGPTHFHADISFCETPGVRMEQTSELKTLWADSFDGWVGVPEADCEVMYMRPGVFARLVVSCGFFFVVVARRCSLNLRVAGRCFVCSFDGRR